MVCEWRTAGHIEVVLLVIVIFEVICSIKTELTQTLGKFTTEGRLAHNLTERTLDHEGQHLNPHDRSNRVSTP